MSVPPIPSFPGMKPQESWFARNWKWAVPVGILACLLLLAAIAGGILAIVFGSMRAIEPYKHAVAVAAADQRVLEALGAPVQPKWYVTGSFNVSTGSGDASLAIPMQGKVRSGTVYVEATKKAGQWSYERLEMEVEGQTEKIQFLKPTSGQSGEY